MNCLLFSFLKTLYFCYNSMAFLSIYNILHTIGKLWSSFFQWDCCQSEIPTYFLSSQLSIQISYLSPVQLVLFKILEYSRECKIPNSKIPNSTYCITQDRQSGIVFCHSWPTPIFGSLLRFLTKERTFLWPTLLGRLTVTRKICNLSLGFRATFVLLISSLPLSLPTSFTRVWNQQSLLFPTM